MEDLVPVGNNKYSSKTEEMIVNNWNSFIISGLLWYVNSVIYIFGWKFEKVEIKGKGLVAYPKRITRDDINNSARELKREDKLGIHKVHRYMKSSAKDLYNISSKILNKRK